MGRPRVLYLVPDFLSSPSGIALHSRTVALALNEAGQDPAVLALKDAPIGVHRKPHRYFPCGGSRPAFVLRAVTMLLRRPHLVLLGHANFSLLGWALARVSGARLVIFLHGVEAWERLPALRRFGLRRADDWIAVSACTANRAASANDLPHDRVSVLHHCLTDPAGMPDLREPPGPSILTVGRIVAAEGYKGHDRVIRAMPALLNCFPDLIYHIVGDGDGRPALESLVRVEGVEDAVWFHGIVSDADLNRLYADASVFVMPSKGEGFGFVFLEAMAHGLPVVAGNADAAPEAVADGETGFLVDPESVDEIIDAAKALLLDPVLRERMGRAGRERVMRQFSYEVFSRRLVTLLGLSTVDGETGL